MIDSQDPPGRWTGLENTLTTEVVAVYTASDLDEGATLVWSLTGPDATDFNIGNQVDATPGTLTFKEMPDYEMPAASNNLYRVTVEVSDGKLKATRPMTVMVTDVEEEGKVTLSSVQPKVAIDLTASLKDSDGDVRMSHGNGSVIPTNLRRTDQRLLLNLPMTPWRRHRWCRDRPPTPRPRTTIWQVSSAPPPATPTGGATGKTAMGVSDNAVIENTDNRAPEFKDQPSSLKIDENSDAGTAVGNIQATDPNGDTLTYSLTGDAALFKITSEDDEGTTQEVEDEDMARSR